MLLVALGAMVLLPPGWIFTPRFHVLSFYVAVAVAVFAGVVTTGWWISDQRLLFVDIVPTAQRTEYMAIYYAWVGLVGGCGPLMAGTLLDRFQSLRGSWWIFPVGPYLPLFLASGLLLCAGLVLLARLSCEDPNQAEKNPSNE